MVLIEDEDQTLEELGVCDEDQIIMEIRNKDLTWPEEISSLSVNSGDKCKQCKLLKIVLIVHTFNVILIINSKI
jgi:ubiquitin carboxyl-terminal hydrolase 6/32